MIRRFSSEQMDAWLTLIGRAVNGRNIDEASECIMNLNWKDFYDICLNNNVTTFLYSAIEKSAVKNNIPFELLQEWKNVAQYIMQRQIMQYAQLRNVLASTEGQLLVFFKGPILADLYPQYLERSSCDTDIWVPEEQYAKTEQSLFDLGYVKNQEESKPEVGVYYLAKYQHTIELHIRLWEDYKGKKIEILSAMNLTERESFIELEACGIPILTLGHTEHMIFQMFHIIKHFSLQGIGIKYLADISLFVNKYQKEIEWDRFWDGMDKLGYTKFCNNFFDICTKYFEMCKITQENTRNEGQLCEEKLWDFIEDLLKKGVIDEGSASWQLFGAMSPYFTGEYNAPKEGWKKKMLILFPSRKSLPNNYGYAKKFPILLPIAWIHRFVLFGIHRFTSKGESYNASQKMEVTQYRLQMMENLGLMEE